MLDAGCELDRSGETLPRRLGQGEISPSAFGEIIDDLYSYIYG